MRALRALYVTVVQLLALPFMVLWAIGYTIYTFAGYVREGEKLMIDDFKNYGIGIVEGIKMAHEQNVKFIKYGMKGLE